MKQTNPRTHYFIFFLANPPYLLSEPTVHQSSRTPHVVFSCRRSRFLVGPVAAAQSSRRGPLAVVAPFAAAVLSPSSLCLSARESRAPSTQMNRGHPPRRGACRGIVTELQAEEYKPNCTPGRRGLIARRHRGIDATLHAGTSSSASWSLED
jgi:hypothetical protein